MGSIARSRGVISVKSSMAKPGKVRRWEVKLASHADQQCSLGDRAQSRQPAVTPEEPLRHQFQAIRGAAIVAPAMVDSNGSHRAPAFHPIRILKTYCCRLCMNYHLLHPERVITYIMLVVSECCCCWSAALDCRNRDGRQSSRLAGDRSIAPRSPYGALANESC